MLTLFLAWVICGVIATWAAACSWTDEWGKATFAFRALVFAAGLLLVALLAFLPLIGPSVEYRRKGV